MSKYGDIRLLEQDFEGTGLRPALNPGTGNVMVGPETMSGPQRGQPLGQREEWLQEYLRMLDQKSGQAAQDPDLQRQAQLQAMDELQAKYGLSGRIG